MSNSPVLDAVYAIRKVDTSDKTSPIDAIQPDLGFFFSKDNADDVAAHKSYEALTSRIAYCNRTRSIGRDEMPIPSFEEFRAPDFVAYGVAPGSFAGYVVTKFVRNDLDEKIVDG